MSVLNVALIGSDEFARSLGKKGDSRDIDSYVHKESKDGGVRVLSLLRPLKHPESIRPLLSVLDVAKAGLLEIGVLDAPVGEAMVALGCSGISTGRAVIAPRDGEWIDPGQVRVMLDQAGLSEWDIMEGDIDEHEIREWLFGVQDELSKTAPDASSSSLILPVDQHFNVKGIGLVAIGYVQSGRVKVHDEVLLLPADGTGNAKSLQVMDDDVEVASAGDRVGLALRNAKEDHLTGSTIIVHPPVEDKRANVSIPLAVEQHTRSTVTLRTSPFQKRVLAPGDVVHASVDLQFVVGRVASVDADRLVVDWDQPLFIRKEQPPSVLIAQLDSKPRIMGSAVMTASNA